VASNICQALGGGGGVEDARVYASFASRLGVSDPDCQHACQHTGPYAVSREPL